MSIPSSYIPKQTKLKTIKFALSDKTHLELQFQPRFRTPPCPNYITKYKLKPIDLICQNQLPINPSIFHSSHSESYSRHCPLPSNHIILNLSGRKIPLVQTTPNTWFQLLLLYNFLLLKSLLLILKLTKLNILLLLRY